MNQLVTSDFWCSETFVRKLYLKKRVLLIDESFLTFMTPEQRKMTLTIWEGTVNEQVLLNDSPSEVWGLLKKVIGGQRKFGLNTISGLKEEIHNMMLLDGLSVSNNVTKLLSVPILKSLNDKGLCPCGNPLHEDEVMNAVSRKDDETLICKECEQQEIAVALENEIV